MLLTACTNSSPDIPHTRTFTDDLGRQVSLQDSIARIVTLSPNMTDLLVAAGSGHRIVGVSSADENPALADSVATFSALPVDFEAVSALEPDLILATDQVNNPQDAETFESLGIPTVFFSFERVSDIPRVIDSLDTLVGAPRADRLADSLRQNISYFKSRTDTLGNRPRVLFLISDAPLYAFGSGSYVNEMIRLAGGRSVTDSLSTAAPVLDEEFVLETRPEVIIGTFGESYKREDLLHLHPTWRHLSAVTENRIFTMPEDWVLRPTPEIIRGIQAMSKFIHPTLIDSNRVATASQ
jgi:iron complex transport system substrate-binding protein